MLRLWVECTLVFAVLPLAYLGSPERLSPLPVVVAVAGGAAWYLWRHGAEMRALWNFAGALAARDPILLRFAAAAPLLTILAWLITPETFMDMPTERPLIWLALITAYPVVSVIPQELVYRAFFFRRYHPILPHPAGMILASALAFGLMHVIFSNVVAPLLTLAGGLFFSRTYKLSGSLAAAVIEHTLYGWVVFTVGWGHYFHIPALSLSKAFEYLLT